MKVVGIATLVLLFLLVSSLLPVADSQEVQVPFDRLQCFVIPSILQQCPRHEKRWTKYFASMERAKAAYTDCGDTCYDAVIQRDLAPWRGGITKNQIDSGHGRVVHYQIIGGRLYRSRECMFMARCNGVEHFIKEIIEKKWPNPGPPIPDLEFIINVSDYPQVNAHVPSPPPIFSFSKTSQYIDIMYPAWTFWEGGPALSTIERTGIGRWDLKFKTLGKSAKRWPWAKKKKVAFFRGSRTSSERDPLIYLSRENPKLFNATYTKNQAWRSEADTLGPPSSEVSLEEHCRYRYLYNFRGVAASFRFKHLFLCRSLVYHVGDEWLEFFYPAMKPWYHYIPVRQDLADARDLVEFFLAHDFEAYKIAEQGHSFIQAHLQMNDIHTYWYRLLTAYAALLKYKVVRNSDLILI